MQTGAALPSPTLLPIGGTMRSGTSLLVDVLDTHPVIEMFDAELRSLVWARESGWSHMNRVLYHLLKRPVWKPSGKFRSEVFHYLFHFARINGLFAQPGYTGIRSAFDATLAKPGCLYVGDKYPQYISILAELAGQPDVRCLAVLRDSRDVVSSLLQRIHHGDWKGLRWTRNYATLELCCDYWNRTASQIQQAQAQYENVHLVVYDRLVSEPAVTLRHLARFLEVDHNGFDFGVVNKSSVAKYRRYLTPQQISEIEDRTGPLMQAFGFTK